MLIGSKFNKCLIPGSHNIASQFNYLCRTQSPEWALDALNTGCVSRSLAEMEIISLLFGQRICNKTECSFFCFQILTPFQKTPKKSTQAYVLVTGVLWVLSAICCLIDSCLLWRVHLQHIVSVLHCTLLQVPENIYLCFHTSSDPLGGRCAAMHSNVIVLFFFLWEEESCVAYQQCIKMLYLHYSCWVRLFVLLMLIN